MASEAGLQSSDEEDNETETTPSEIEQWLTYCKLDVLIPKFNGNFVFVLIFYFVYH